MFDQPITVAASRVADGAFERVFTAHPASGAGFVLACLDPSQGAAGQVFEGPPWRPAGPRLEVEHADFWQAFATTSVEVEHPVALGMRLGPASELAAVNPFTGHTVARMPFDGVPLCAGLACDGGRGLALAVAEREQGFDAQCQVFDIKTGALVNRFDVWLPVWASDPVVLSAPPRTGRVVGLTTSQEKIDDLEGDFWVRNANYVSALDVVSGVEIRVFEADGAFGGWVGVTASGPVLAQRSEDGVRVSEFPGGKPAGLVDLLYPDLVAVGSISGATVVAACDYGAGTADVRRVGVPGASWRVVANSPIRDLVFAGESLLLATDDGLRATSVAEPE